MTLYESVQEFTVAEVDGKVIGCGALHVLWDDLAEVRTVAVEKSFHLLFLIAAVAQVFKVMRCHAVMSS